MDKLFNNKYYIIRVGDFATNGNRKILYFLFSLLLCFEEYFTIQSLNCFKIMFGSSIIWSFIELLLHLSNTRIIKPMYIGFGENKRIINNYLGICLQGLQEGGFVTTFGLYFRIDYFKLNILYCYIYLLHLSYLIYILEKTMKNYQKDK